ncbi:MAG: hypothetical protein ABI583_09930 [Betaproteobacteria bacterium]
MKCNARIAGAVLVGIGTILLANYAQGISAQHRKRITKKLAKEAVNAWEDEGGAVSGRTPLTSAA